MELYDTRRRAVVPVQPRDGRIGLYVCGITPYDAAHLGHAFTYHSFDLLTRRLRATGTEVVSVRNITDVDDDMIRVGRERQRNWRELGNEQVALFDREMASIDIAPVQAAPRASENVEAMVEWVRRLVDAGVAYEVDGWVFFHVPAFAPYGQLSRRSRDAMITLSRENGADPDDPRKRDPLDFVLWQRSLPDEPSWPSPWGKGRPGWHIECTVMSTGILGTPIDIHGGGADLVYPHHESEIAQAEPIAVQPYVHHWAHVGMVRFQGEKMSKSLGNLVFVHQLLARVPAATVRILLSAQHYRDSWEYQDVQLEAADTRRRRYETAASSPRRIDPEQAGRWLRSAGERLDADLDSPGVLSVLDSAAESINGAGADSDHPEAIPAAAVMQDLLAILGITLIPAPARM